MTDTLTYRSHCPVASALDIIGDKWSLVVVRGMFVGQSRFREFLKAPEGISSNILADRLRLLERAGIINRQPGEAVATHYHYRLTRKGAELLPVLQALAVWGFMHIANRWQPPQSFITARPADFYPHADRGQVAAR